MKTSTLEVYHAQARSEASVAPPWILVVWSPWWETTLYWFPCSTTSETFTKNGSWSLVLTVGSDSSNVQTCSNLLWGFDDAFFKVEQGTGGGEGKIAYVVRRWVILGLENAVVLREMVLLARARETRAVPAEQHWVFIQSLWGLSPGRRDCFTWWTFNLSYAGQHCLLF